MRSRLAEVAEQVANTAVRTTADIVTKSKRAAEKYALEARLQKCYRMLGALAYAEAKGEEQSLSLVSGHVSEIDSILKQLADLEKLQADVKVYYKCDCGAGEQEDAMFCGRCGQKLS